MLGTKWNLKRNILPFSVLLLLAACNSDEEVKKVIQSAEPGVVEQTVNKVDEDKIEEETPLTLAEQGFTIEDYSIDYNEGIIIFELNGPEGEYFGLMNSNFEWILSPTKEIVDFTSHNNSSEMEKYFSEGLLRVAVEEDREIRANLGETEAYKWGYINTNGEWAVEPIFRKVSGFSDGVAIVTTIEEDRDDLSNARQIVIDTSGNELFELIPKFNLRNRPDENYHHHNFSGGYLKADKGVYDLNGGFQVIDFVQEPQDEGEGYILVDNKVIYFQGSKLELYDLKNKERSTIPLKQEINGIYTTSELADEKKFEVVGYSNNGESFRVLMDVKGNEYFSNSSFAVLGSYLVVNESEETDVVYNFNGEKLAEIPGSYLRGSNIVNDMYWIEGDEYYKLVTLEGDVIINEDKKIRLPNGFEELGKVVNVRQRVNAADPDLVPALLNIETLELVRETEILTKK